MCFFPLNVVQKLVFLFPCFCTVTSASVHLPGRWEGQGLEMWWQWRRRQSWPGQAWLGLFPQDDIIPFSELMRASGAWHMGSSQLLGEGFRNFDVLFKDMSCCVSSCHNFIISHISINRELYIGSLVCCVYVFPRSAPCELQ